MASFMRRVVFSARVCLGEGGGEVLLCRVMPEMTFADTDSRAGPSRVAVCVSATALFPFL